MTRALSIPPDAAARMMMLVTHEKKARESQEKAIPLRSAPSVPNEAVEQPSRMDGTENSE